MSKLTIEPAYQLQEELVHIVFDPVFPKHWLINKPVEEVEGLAMREAEEVSPRYARGKRLKRRGYARYRFLTGFSVVMEGRRIEYRLRWMSVRLPVMYDGKGRVRTGVERELLREEEDVLRKLLTFYSVLGGKMNARLWTPELEVEGDFRYVIADGKWVKLRGGKGVLLVAMGVTREGRKAVLDFLLAKEEDARSYWRLFARVWRKFNFKLVVADMVRSVDSASTLWKFLSIVFYLYFI
ncbi:transposase [Metallosphaera javensis (ex Sakai et al. 2022)]|uniref:transposase n=1 Tax=Metallosphaera javensis (ex Sakai et al. 2022) TaxID=2775498 RepID=UPI00308C7C58|nr:MAG: hypothetical protein MjAS7_2397 [Metallosphaera javensis (ex Sakai et al. 2022)]